MKPIPNSGPWVTDFEKEIVNKALGDWYDDPYHYCELFEYEFAKYHNRKYALMTPNCTSAIHLLLLALGISEGDEILAPECTWIASVAPVFYQNANLVLCDIEADSWCISADSIEKNITPKTKAIIVVNLFGNMADWDKISKISEKYNIPVIEDAAESLCSCYKGELSGRFGVGSVYSFHRTKTLTTGEGGMLILDNDELFKRAKMFRDHGRNDGDPMYLNAEVGYKYMPNNITSALGYAQFLRLDELINKKRWILHRYKDKLQDIENLSFNMDESSVYNSAWITTMVVGVEHHIDGSELIERLAEYNILARPFFYPLSSIPALVKRGFSIEKSKKNNPVSYDISSRGVNLPSPLNITEEQLDYICNKIIYILKG